MNKINVSQYNTEKVAIRNEIRDEKIKNVPIEKIYFRESNHRCKCELEELVTKYGITMEQVSEDIIRNQDLIVQSLNASFNKNDYQQLKEELRQKGQTEPIVLSKGNIVQNGNSRLLIMKELYKEDPIKFKSFETVRCIYLPEDISEEEEEEYEINCQIQNETKIDYNWYNIGRWVNEFVSKKGYSLEKVRKKFKMKTIAEVEQYLNAYNEGVKYLMHIGKPNQFNLIENDMVALCTIAKLRKKIINEPSKQKLAIKLSYLYLSSDKEEKGERLYSKLTKIFKYIDDIIDVLPEYKPIYNEMKKVSRNVNIGQKNVAEIDILDLGEVSKSEKLLQAFSNIIETNKKEITNLASDVITLEDFKEENEKNIKMPEINLKSALDFIRRAYTVTDKNIHDLKEILRYISEIKEEIEYYEEKLNL